MNLTNRLNLPKAIEIAVRNDPYDKGDCDFSATELLNPPRLWSLKKTHAHELSEDVADRLWSLYGQIGHMILERANLDDLSEKRFFAKVAGFKISAQIDSLSIDEGALSDFKFSTSYGFMKGREPKKEWVAQLNIQNFILSENGVNAKSLRIVGLLRDWQIREADKSVRYPQAPIAIHPIEMWKHEDTKAFIEKRIEMLLKAKETLPRCEDEDTWGGRRCKSYCDVSSYCTQYKETK